MKSKAFVCLLAAGSLTFGSLSFAQGYDHRGDNRRDEQRNDQRHDNHQGDRHDDRRDDRHGGYDRDHGRQDHYYYGARGPEWHRGGRLPQTYRSHQYVVNDWRGHHLSAPPRGYQWVQVGNDYVLAAIATGIIAQLLLNN
jgi:Ni/Co efflux regulator RcnB